ncbi:MAG TPA: UDP-N-acetylglucosamine 2-epimerase (non-hydrolyzing) [Syntrophobacter fumaroxidans]|nr:UDP-N-acetylglucosamine 2-epimerase (non-hydrolyzing) [Syntrophobacter fumaroxidans]
MKFLNKNELNPRISVVIGTRPGIIMFSPIIRALSSRNLDFFTIHSGQHYSYNMDELLFDQLMIPKPTHHLQGISDKKLHGAQTAAMMERIERILITEKPAILLVGGDANTNLAGALAARKLHIAVGHVEAGERSYDWRMPEEHNRRIMDHISEYLFATNEKAKQQLFKENVMGEVFVTGNPIVDAAFQNIELARESSAVLKRNRLKEKGYVVLTVHREENVDSEANLNAILDSIELVHRETRLPVFFPAHPRTLNRLEMFGLVGRARSIEGVTLSEAIGYLDFLRLLSGAALVMTDSGGVQQEACILNIPCVTLRENTEWMETLSIGANTLAGLEKSKVVAAVMGMLGRTGSWTIPFGDGSAARNIVRVVEDKVLRGWGKSGSPNLLEKQ